MRSRRLHAVTGALAAFAIALTVAGCSSSAGDKAGGDQEPRTLRLGTVEGPQAPYADHVQHFADAVESVSDGSLTVEIVWEAPGPYTADSELNAAAMVKNGDLDLAIVPTRVWDQLDVTTMQALQAPFLVDSLPLVHEIASDALADEMLAGLDPLGVKGLAMWPESLRHPFGIGSPLATAADFAGARLRVPVSDASYRLARAIGAEPVDPVDWDEAIARGELDGFESGFVWSNDLPAYGTFTANLTFYPKVNTVVANAAMFDSLSDDQQRDVRRAATDTVGYVVESNATERDLAAAYCADGGSVALASETDRADLVAMAGPVLADLEKDVDTKRLIDRITVLKEKATPDAAMLPEACEPESATSAEPEAGQLSTTFPEGVYRAENKIDGVITMTFRNGIWSLVVDENGPVICESTYAVVEGRFVLTTTDDPVLDCDNPHGEVWLDATWSLEGDQLRFTDINSDPRAVDDFSLPWTRIG